MTFTLEQLETFFHVTREQSFSGAARKMKKTQAAVSMTVANLEVDLGVTLFERSGRYPTLTSDGAILLKEVNSILHQCSLLVEKANYLSTNSENKIRLAIDDVLSFDKISKIIANFQGLFPYVELEVIHPRTNEILNLVKSGEVALAILFSVPDYPIGMQFRRLGSTVFKNVANVNHPLIRHDTVEFTDLMKYTQIVYTPYQDRFPTSEYLKSPSQYKVDNQIMLSQMLLDNIGWASIPSRMIEMFNVSDELSEINISSYPHTEWSIPIDLIWLSSYKFGDAGKWLKLELSKVSYQ